VGTSQSGAQLAAKLDKLGRELRDVKRPLNATALEGKRIFAGTAAAAGASRLARARYDINGNQAVIRYAGAKAHLVNSPTKAHRIEPRSGRRSRGRRALTIGGDVRAYANHPGTRGKRFFEAARAICQTVLPRVYGREQLTEPLRRIF
jgi:hypothetical protein